MSAVPEHLLIVDDDREIRNLLTEYLEQAGYRVTAVGDGKAMRRALETNRIDLVVLDLMLPGEDGLSLCRDLRRAQALPTNMETDTVGSFGFAGWTLDVTTRNVLAPDGLVVPLSGAEYRLLRVLLDHPQRVLARDQLLELANGREAIPFDRSIDVLVGRLRKRLRDDSREPELIKTVRGEGYVLAATVERGA